MIPPWTVGVDARPPGRGEQLSLDVDPRRRRLSLGPRVVGLGSADVGQLVVYRRFYPDAVASPAAEAWLAGDEVAAMLAGISAGYRVSMLWSGDQVGAWEEAAWRLAEGLADGVGARLSAGGPGASGP